MEFWSLVQLLAEGEQKQQQPDTWMVFAPFVLIAVFFYLLFLRPQRKEQAEREAQVNALKKNDRVLTIGGIIGTVANISADGKEVSLKVDDNTRIKFLRSSIQRVMSAEGEPEKPADAK